MLSTLEIILLVVNVLQGVINIPIWKWFLELRDAKKQVETLQQINIKTDGEIEKLKLELDRVKVDTNKENRAFEKILGEFSIAVARLEKTCENLSEAVTNNLINLQREATLQREQFMKILIELINKNGN